MMGFCIFHGKVEEALQFVWTVGNQSDVIGLADAADVSGTEVDPQLGELGHLKLGVVGQFIETVTQNPTLLDTETIVDGPHEASFPLDKSLAIGEPVVEEDQPLTPGSCEEGGPNADLGQDFVKR